MALLPSCPRPGADGRRPQPPLEIGTGWFFGADDMTLT